MAWLVAGVVVLLIVVTGGLVWALSGGDAHSVEEVADQAVDAAEDLDVDAGIDLLCDAPSGEERDQMEELIDSAQDESGTDDPEVSYEISEVEGDAEGSFRVTVTSDEAELADEELVFDVIVEEEDGRSCIASAEAVE